MAVYGVGTRNAFEVLDDDDSSKKSKSKKTTTVLSTTTTTSNNRTQNVNALSAPDNGTFDSKPTSNLRGKGRGRTPRDGGGRGRDRVETTSSGKRVYDRRSGTGRGTENRKQGYGGSGAEGTIADELTGQLEDNKQVQEVTKTETVKPTKVIEPEEKVVVFSDYQNAMKAKLVDDSKKSLRKAEEPKDSKLFKKGKTFEKKEETFFGLKQNTKKVEEEKPKEKTEKVKNTLSVDEFSAKFGGDTQVEEQTTTTTTTTTTNTNSDDTQSGFVDQRRGGRGGRGRGNNRGGRGNTRGGRGGRGSSINLKDESSFPSLSGRK